MPLRLPTLGILMLIAGTGCYSHTATPAPALQAIPEQDAVSRSYTFAQWKGYRPASVRKATYHPNQGVWRVNLNLGPPSCGVLKLELNGFDGHVIKYDPKLYPCEAPPPQLDPDL
jgi:hypothetical protein